MSRDEMIEISAELVQDRESSWAVWDGEMEPDPRSPDKERKKLAFLPKSQCEKLDDNTFMVPEWLAHEKGLI